MIRTCWREDNPLHYLCALGVLLMLPQARISWSGSATLHGVTAEEVVNAVLRSAGACHIEDVDVPVYRTRIDAQSVLAAIYGPWGDTRYSWGIGALARLMLCREAKRIRVTSEAAVEYLISYGVSNLPSVDDGHPSPVRVGSFAQGRMLTYVTWSSVLDWDALKSLGGDLRWWEAELKGPRAFGPARRV